MSNSSRPHRLQPGSPVYGILQARALEWGAIAFIQLHRGLKKKEFKIREDRKEIVEEKESMKKT